MRAAVTSGLFVAICLALLVADIAYERIRRLDRQRRRWTVNAELPGMKGEHPDQLALDFEAMALHGDGSAPHGVAHAVAGNRRIASTGDDR
jgi:hypothetical protein